MRGVLTLLAAACLASPSAFADESGPESWAGPYAGLSGGYSWIHRHAEHFSWPSGAPLNSGKVKSEGSFGGLHAGYDFSLESNWLVGVEASAFYGFSRNLTTVYGGATSVTEVESHNKWRAMARARLGYLLPGTPLLAYGSFGFYYTYITTERRQLAGTNGGLTAGMKEDESVDAIGWIGGAGIEARIAPNWTVRAEFLHSETTATSIFEVGRLRTDSKTHAKLILVGTSYRF